MCYNYFEYGNYNLNPFTEIGKFYMMVNITEIDEIHLNWKCCDRNGFITLLESVNYWKLSTIDRAHLNAFHFQLIKAISHIFLGNIFSVLIHFTYKLTFVCIIVYTLHCLVSVLIFLYMILLAVICTVYCFEKAVVSGRSTMHRHINGKC